MPDGLFAAGISPRSSSPSSPQGQTASLASNTRLICSRAPVCFSDKHRSLPDSKLALLCCNQLQTSSCGLYLLAALVAHCPGSCPHYKLILLHCPLKMTASFGSLSHTYRALCPVTCSSFEVSCRGESP